MSETIDANKERLGPEAALKLLDDIRKLIVVVRGKQIVEFDLKTNRPDDDTLRTLMIGPTGNLRAPTVRIGKMLLVGYNEEAYRRFVG